MPTHTVLCLVGPSPPHDEDLDEMDPQVRLGGEGGGVVDTDEMDPQVRPLAEKEGVKLVFLPELDSGSVEASEITAVLVVGHGHVDVPLLDRLPNLKVVSNYGVGVDHIDLEACRARGIPVGNTPNVLSDSTADMGWTLLMACARRVVEGDRYARGPDYQKYENMLYLGKDVTDATLGIVGMGRIGGEVARRAAGFRMRVLYCNRSQRPQEEEEELKAEFVSKERLLAESDFIVLVCPMTPQTHHFIDAEALAAMKSDAVLVNIARGGVVDTDALTKALQENQIGAAGLDVTDPEPLPRDHPLHKLDNVTLVPHRGSATKNTRFAMASLCIKNLAAGLAGEELAARCN